MASRFSPLPAPGDIVWCHFPQSLGRPGPKPRPAIVLRVAALDHAVEVAYGTSQKTHALFLGEFVLDPSDAGFQLSGLAARTKFDLGKHQILFFDSDWFAPSPGVHVQSPLPKLGTLHPSYMAGAASARAQVP